MMPAMSIKDIKPMLEDHDPLPHFADQTDELDERLDKDAESCGVAA